MNEPASVSIIYGPTHTGKTVLAGECFSSPDTLFIGRSTGADSIRHFLGIPDIRRVPINTLDGVIKAVQQARKNGFKAVIVDDVSLCAESQLQVLQANSGDKRAAYAEINNMASTLREVLAAEASRGLHSVISAHEKPAGVNGSGQMFPGGPKMPTWNSGVSLVHEASLVLRTAHDTTRAGWPVSMYCDHNSSWNTKDRYNVTYGRMYPNLRVLLSQRFDIPRHPEVQWFDDVIPGLVEHLQGEENTPETLWATFWEKLLSAGKREEHVRWCMSEAVGLHEFNKSRTMTWANYFKAKDPSAGILG